MIINMKWCLSFNSYQSRRGKKTPQNSILIDPKYEDQLKAFTESKRRQQTTEFIKVSLLYRHSAQILCNPHTKLLKFELYKTDYKTFKFATDESDIYWLVSYQSWNQHRGQFTHLTIWIKPINNLHHKITFLSAHELEFKKNNKPRKSSKLVTVIMILLNKSEILTQKVLNFEMYKTNHQKFGFAVNHQTGRDDSLHTLKHESNPYTI